MREAEYRAWLEAQGYTEATATIQIGRVRRIERSYGDLDALFQRGELAQLQQDLAYSKQDERAGKPNPAKFPVDGNIYNNMATYRQTLDYYRRFLAGESARQLRDSDITRDAVENAMDEYDALGLDGFREKYGYGKPQKYWVRRPANGQLYPAKAIAGVSFGYVEGGTSLQASGFYGGQGERAANGILRGLGYEIVSRTSADASDAPAQPQTPAPAPAAPTNLILYGPPGTGKTYCTAREAVALCDGAADYPETIEGRAALMARYKALVDDKRIAFVTFHQNYGYEDFVEGLRPKTGDDDGETAGFRLEAEPGIFRQIAERAATSVPAGAAFNLMDCAVYKMSLGEVADAASDFVFRDSIAGGYALLGFHDVDWTDPRFEDRDEILAELKARFPDADITAAKGMVQSPDVFRNRLEVGDLLIVAMGNRRFRAIGVVDGDYEYAPRPDGRYCHRRKVRWLWHDAQGRDVAALYPPQFIQRTIYRLKDSELNRPLIAELIGSGRKPAQPLPHVLIIDEINRANVSKVFGELITLLEPDKRAGMPNALSVTLPYSKRAFAVPANLHIIGTMNSADRSIALLDTALRRRFEFREMAPDPSLLGEVDGIDLRDVLATINRRIEYLIGRDHCIGHAFFIGCRTAAEVEAVMRRRIIPLLQEYFFEDWSRVATVLGTGFIAAETLAPPPGMDREPQQSWSVPDSFEKDAFARLLAGE